MVGGFAEIAFNRCRTRVLHLAHLVYRVYSKRQGGPPPLPLPPPVAAKRAYKTAGEGGRKGEAKDDGIKRRKRMRIKIR